MHQARPRQAILGAGRPKDSSLLAVLMWYAVLPGYLVDGNALGIHLAQSGASIVSRLLALIALVALMFATTAGECAA